MSTCKADGCERNVHAHGFCSKHYAKFRKYGDPLVVRQEQKHGLSLKDRLYARMSVNGACWEWTGSLNNKGYGMIGLSGTPALVHRVSWEVHNGVIPGDMNVLHKCDNPKCFRPIHLFLGTQQENMNDMKRKRRQNNPAKVKHGEQHGGSKLTEDNVREIRASNITGVAIASKYDVSTTTISDIRNRRIWKHI